MSRWTLWTSVSILALTLTLGALPAVARVGGKPPPFELPPAQGGPSSEPFRLSAHLGKNPVVILFWATWCGPCMQEMPFYQKLYEEYRDQGLQVVAISMDSQSTVMRAGPTARRLGVTYDVVTDLDTRVTTQMNPRQAAPFSIWVNREGRIVWEREGFAPSEKDVIEKGIAKLVKSGKGALEEEKKSDKPDS
ncbi:MAG TPA: TlpA disulfide reductase family protein [Myxococcales bacterium LLY-WYZ-16_1]|jgi:thiol-disulfide isomerase/thioredoxin|nr:TlpA disulfide reductase family protein [Myxococcales bacterium LLY-WYZ-16_1]